MPSISEMATLLIKEGRGELHFLWGQPYSFTLSNPACLTDLYDLEHTLLLLGFQSDEWLVLGSMVLQ